MYSAGDLVVYGSTGVCRVEGVGSPALPGADGGLYYKLTPVLRGGVIYTPVDTRVQMRPVVSLLEAQRVLDQLPQLVPQPLEEMSAHQLSEFYSSAIAAHRLPELARLAISIHRRRCTPERQRCRYGRVDVKYMKLAEELLFGELSAALGATYDEVRDRFIAGAKGLVSGL